MFAYVSSPPIKVVPDEVLIGFLMDLNVDTNFSIITIKNYITNNIFILKMNYKLVL
jgi:hypothetical protein